MRSLWGTATTLMQSVSMSWDGGFVRILQTLLRQHAHAPKHTRVQHRRCCMGGSLGSGMAESTAQGDWSAGVAFPQVLSSLVGINPLAHLLRPELRFACATRNFFSMLQPG